MGNYVIIMVCLVVMKSLSILETDTVNRLYKHAGNTDPENSYGNDQIISSIWCV